MSAQVTKRARIAKVRGIEKRLAEIALGRANRELRHVESIVERLKMLENELGTTGGTTSGAALAAISEMKMRLASAGRATAKPLRDAATRRDEQYASAMTAHRKADGAESMLRQSSAEAAKAEAIRADASRIVRRADMSGGEA